MIYRFGDFRLDTASNEMTQAGQPVAVEPQVFAIIAHLVAHRDRVVSKDELLDAVWQGRVVSDATLNTRINQVRGALGDDGKRQAAIKTLPRRGFRFLLPVEQETDSAPVNTADSTPSIAVLPFRNLSRDPQHDFLGDALAEDLTTALARVRLYRVVSLDSARALALGGAEPSRIGAELKSTFVVSGGVTLAGDLLRISARLDDVTDDRQIWAQRFEGNYTDIFEIQDRVVEALIGQLEPELDLAGFRKTRNAPTENLNAWELYQKAMILVSRREADPTREAIELFGMAVKIDPNFSRAHAAICQAHGHLFVTTGDRSHFDNMLEAANKAVAGDSGDYWSHVALGIALFHRDIPRALNAFDTAIRLNPHSAATRAWHAIALMADGRAEAAVNELQLAIRLSPGDPWIGPFWGRLCRAQYYLGRYEEAVESATRAFNFAHVWPVHAAYVASLVRLERWDEAATALERLKAKLPGISRRFILENLPDGHPDYLGKLVEDLKTAGLD